MTADTSSSFNRAGARCGWGRATLVIALQCAAVLVLALVAAGCASAPTSPATQAFARFDAGPVAASDHALEGYDRVRIAGPLYESQSTTNGLTFSAVRPFTSSVRDAETGRAVRDVLWPLCTTWDWNNQRSWHFLLVGFAHNADTRAADPKSRFWLFPFVFTGRDALGERYFALFPLGGTLRDFGSRDRIEFALFPAYAHTAINDLSTHHVLWPFVAWTRGGHVDRLRVFPFYGRSAERKATKRFVLWPFWTSVDYHHRAETGSSYILFPLVGRVNTDRQKGWMVLPPLFRWSESDKRTQVNAPWPLIQYSRGDVDKTYIWPLWGTRSERHVDRWFCLWPLIRHDRVARSNGDLHRFVALPFLYTESVLPSTGRVARVSATGSGMAAAGVAPRPLDAPTPAPGAALSRNVILWPLLQYRREGEDAFLRALALWPFKRTAPVDRNLAPFWTLYAHTRSGEAREDDLLWGLWRRQTAADGSHRVSLFPLWRSEHSGAIDGPKRWAVLYGLIGHEREGLKSRFRLLYFVSFDTKGWVTRGAPAGDSESSKKP